jgi:hypothetical protein
MSGKNAFFGVVGLVLLTAAAAPAKAQELVQNGGFETGDFTGWTEFGDTYYNGVGSGDPPYVHGGVYGAYFGPTDPAGGGISQVLALNVGDHVHVSFWYLSENGLTPNWMTVTLGSVSVFSTTNVTSTVYTQFAGDFVVADAAPVLTITFYDAPDWLDLDDVSVMLTGGGGHCGSADFNCDGAVATDADIEAFFACLAGSCPPPPCTSTADFNGDGAVATDADIEAFFRVLSGLPC